MPGYRFYQITAKGHVKDPPTDHDAPDDRAAIRKAHQLLDANDIEVWQGKRVVAYVAADEKSPVRSG
jgi:hypothetical protein